MQKTYRTATTHVKVSQKRGDKQRLEKSAIILAGGSSTRLGQDKGLLLLSTKSLVTYVLDKVDKIVDEKIVVVSDTAQAKNYAKIVGQDVNVLVDASDAHGPIVGALTGFSAAKSAYSVLLPCDTPMISKKVLILLFELCINKNATIPRWPNGYIEPLQAVYNTKRALEVARSTLDQGRQKLQNMIDQLHGIRYISTLVLQQVDPELRTFFNINTLIDLRKAESISKKTETTNYP